MDKKSWAFPSKSKWIPIVVGIWIVGFSIPLMFHDPFILHVANLIFLDSVLAMSWLILARTGYVSFAHNAFLGIGAYTSAYLVMRLHFPYWGGLVGAGAIAAGFALVLGAIILRLRGIFFVLSTFCFAQIMLRVFRMAVPITGGANGIVGIPPPEFPLVGTIASHGEFYALFYTYASLMTLFTARLFSSSTGICFKAVEESALVAESMGINTTKQKISAFVISSAIVGISGSLYAHYTHFIADTTFEMTRSIEVVVYNVVGGMGSIVGSIIGAAIMVPLPELLRGFVAYQIALYGLILILIIRFFPSGIWGTFKTFVRGRNKKEKTSGIEAMRMSSTFTEYFEVGSIDSSSSSDSLILECSGVTKSFGGLKALWDVSFSVKNREILGIVGPNGAGKSTLFNAISGVIPPDEGTVTFNGTSVEGMRASKIGMLGLARVFQAAALYRESTIRENINRSLIPRARFNGIKDLCGLEQDKGRWVDQQSELIMKMLGLEDLADELPKNLPHGFQRLVGLAMALATKPKLLLLDEPVTGMTQDEMNTIATTLEHLRHSGMTMIIVEHNVNFVMRLCSRIAVLNYGVKIAEGSPHEISNNPTVIEAFLGT